MSNSWFRFYHEWDSDPKVQMMTENMQRRLAMLFCWRCKEETFQETRAAFHWRISLEEIAQTKAVFIANGFIDENWELLNWDRRQFISDSSTDRVRRHRQALKQNETLRETVAPVPVTPPDTEADTEQKQNRASRAQESPRDPDSGSQFMLATNLLEEIGVPSDPSLVCIAAECIRLLTKEGGTTQTAAQYILEAGRRAREQGEVINRFWFTDQRYRPREATKTRRQIEKEAKRKAFLEEK